MILFEYYLIFNTLFVSGWVRWCQDLVVEYQEYLEDHLDSLVNLVSQDSLQHPWRVCYRYWRGWPHPSINSYIFSSLGWSTVGSADAGQQPRPGGAAQETDAGRGRTLPSPRGRESSSPVDVSHHAPSYIHHWAREYWRGTNFKLLAYVVLLLYCCLYQHYSRNKILLMKSHYDI